MKTSFKYNPFLHHAVVMMNSVFDDQPPRFARGYSVNSDALSAVQEANNGNNLFRDFWLALAMLGFFACFASMVHAGTNRWTSIGLVVNEGIGALAIDPLDPATLYVATSSDIFKSTNGGAKWQTVNTGPTNNGIASLAIDPVNPTTLYVAKHLQGVFKSTDAGASWQAVNTGLFTGQGFGPIAIDPLNPTTLYVGTDFGGIFKSNNAGASWQTLNWNGAPSPIVLWVSALAIDPVNTTNLYAGTVEGVFKSTDAGTSWQAINIGLTNLRISDLAIDPVTPTTLYTGTNFGGIFKSSNAGVSWQKLNIAPDLWVSALAIDPISTTNLYAGTGRGVFKSTDSGGHWQQVNRGLGDTMITAMAIDPVTPSTVYAGTPGGGGGVFKITFASTPEPSPNVVLLLHGMNAIPTTPKGITPKGTWNDFATQYFNANCPSIDNGKITATAKPNAQNTYCYAVKFGSLDAGSPDKGLEDAWDYGESNGYDSAGDYSSFEQLGTEIDKAITAIRKKRPDARILLIGHSRGGLAARAFLQQPAPSENKNSVASLMTIGTPHKGTQMGRIYRYIQNVLLDANGKRVTGVSWINDDWQAIDFLRGTRGCNGTSFYQDFRLDALRPVIGYLSDASRMIKALNDNKGNLPFIKYGEIVYSGEYLGKLQADPLYNLFDEPGADFCDQVSTHAEAFIKGGTFDAPTPSTDYPGDGIVTAGSQGAAVLPKAVRHIYTGFGVLHTDEPKQTAHIADMTCWLDFPWLKSCAATAQASTTKQAQAPFKAIEIISDDYDALVALSVDSLWQDWLAVITDDTQANPREQLTVALGIKLRGVDDAAFYADIEQRLLNANVSQLERARFVKLLAEIATPSALEILTDALLDPESSAIQTALSNAILTTADSLPEQPRRADLSAVLETAWTLPKQNQQQHITLALALAKLGAPRGVALLLAAVRDLPSAKKKTLSHAEQQAKAAFIAMPEIINPDSVMVLSHAFMSHRATEAVFIAAGNGLVNLGRDDAAQRVLQRINELPDAAVPVGQQWLGRLSGKIDKAALRSINKTLGLPRQPQLRQQMQDMVQ